MYNKTCRYLELVLNHKPYFRHLTKIPLTVGRWKQKCTPKLLPLIKKQGFVQLDLDIAFMTTSSGENEPFIPFIKLKLMGFFSWSLWLCSTEESYNTKAQNGLVPNLFNSPLIVCDCGLVGSVCQLGPASRRACVSLRAEQSGHRISLPEAILISEDRALHYSCLS